MREFRIIGTAHIRHPPFLKALEAALDEAAPDQLLLEMPDAAALAGEVVQQKPEMTLAWRWAERHGVPVRGHEPAGPPILKEGLAPERIAKLAEEMDALVQALAPAQLLDIFCDRRPPNSDAEHRLQVVITELIDREKALARTRDMLKAVHDLAAPTGTVLILCGGNHAPHLAAALPRCRIIRGEHFY